MKFVNYVFFVSFFVCFGCSAEQKAKLPDLVCPYILPAEKDFPSGWLTIGKGTGGNLMLQAIGLIDAGLSDVKKRDFSEEVLDYWDDYKDRSELTTTYDADHREAMMKCVYAKSPSESLDRDVRNVVLLIPLPQKKPVTCLLVRRDVDPRYEMSCKVK